jgi:recombination protein RecT
MNTQLINVQEKTFSRTLQRPDVQMLIKKSLSDSKRAISFIANITSAVSVNPKLQQCDHWSIISGGLLAESLNLSLSPSLGQCYLIPFGDKATFICGYKGYVQLAMRTGQYKKLNAVAVKQGEFLGYNPFEETVLLSPILDPIAREVAETVGYYAFFEYNNGFRKEIYWDKAQVLKHRQKYSKNRTSSNNIWDTHTDAMGCKVVLRQLITHWGLMSSEIEAIVSVDECVINDDLTPSIKDDTSLNLNKANEAPNIEVSNEIDDFDFNNL